MTSPACGHTPGNPGAHTWHQSSDCRGLEPVHPFGLRLVERTDSVGSHPGSGTDCDPGRVISLFTASVSPSVQWGIILMPATLGFLRIK